MNNEASTYGTSAVEMIENWKLNIDGRYQVIQESDYGHLVAEETAAKVDDLVQILSHTVVAAMQQDTDLLKEATEQSKARIEQSKRRLLDMVDEREMKKVIDSADETLDIVHKRHQDVHLQIIIEGKCWILLKRERICRMIENFIGDLITEIKPDSFNDAQGAGKARKRMPLPNDSNTQHVTCRETGHTQVRFPQQNRSDQPSNTDVELRGPSRSKFKGLGYSGGRKLVDVTSDGSVSSTEQIDGRSRTAQRQPQIPTTEHWLHMRKRHIYLIGGSRSRNAYVTSVINTYDLLIGSMEPGGFAMTMRRHSHSAVYCQEKNQIVVVGGTTGSRRTVDEAEFSAENCYLITAIPTFQRLAFLREKRMEPTCICIGTKIYVIGGLGTNRFECYDLDRQIWLNKAPLRYNMDGLCSVLYQDHDKTAILILGRCDNDEEQKVMSVRQYNVDQDVWREIADLPTPLHYSAAVNWGGTVYVIGGRDVNHQRLAATRYVYSLDQNEQWVSRAQMNTPRSYHQAVVYRGKIVVLGGKDECGNKLKSVEIFDGVSWAYASDMSTSISSFAALSFE